MRSRYTQAGGCLLAFCIIGGFILGAMSGEAPRGALIGTAAGVTLAVAVWLVDRRKG